MEGNEHQFGDSAESDRVGRRLRKLRHRPIDTSSLARRVRDELGLPKALANASRPRRFAIKRIAAVLVIAGSAASLFLWWSARAVMASPVELSRAHAENIRGEPGAIQVSSMAEAHRVIAAHWSSCPHLREPSAGTVVSCHVHFIGCKRLLCIKVMVDGTPVTVAVAHATDLRLPDVLPVAHKGIMFFEQADGDTNIVITNCDGLWFCLVGQTSPERLIEIADAMTCTVLR